MVRAWVYGFQSGEFIKVGVASNVNARLQMLRLYNPHPCQVVFRRRCRDARFVEGRIHKLLAEYSVGREWFRITKEQLETAALAALAAEKERRIEQIRWETESRRRLEDRTKTKRATRGMGVETSSAPEAQQGKSMP